jgi:hypothetical protein
MASLSRPSSVPSSLRPTAISNGPNGQNLYHRLKQKVISPDDRKRSPFGSPFLSLDDIDEMITKDVLEAKMPLLSWLLDRGRASQIVECAKKVYAILWLCGEEELIWDLFAEGLTDDDLPLAKSQMGGQYDTSKILESSQGKQFQSFSKLKNDATIDHFLDTQWLVLAPVFTKPGEHICIPQQAPLPFCNIEKMSPGSKSTVYRGILHAAYLVSIMSEYMSRDNCGIFWLT